MKNAPAIFSVSLALLIAAACARNKALQPVDPNGVTRTGSGKCSKPQDDYMVTDREINAQVKVLGKSILDASGKAPVTVQKLYDALPSVREFERLEYRLCLAAEQGRISPAQYKAYIDVLLPKPAQPKPELIRTTSVSAATPDRNGIDCDHRSPCSPDGKWWAAITPLVITAAADQEVRNPVVSCRGSTCGFLEIMSTAVAADGHSATAQVKTWSNSVTLTYTAEIWSKASQVP
jgi:hypothetical protein